VLGDVVSVVMSVPLDSSFYMGREVVLGLADDGGSLVVRGKGNL
jgi:hypothetical protein